MSDSEQEVKRGVQWIQQVKSIVAWLSLLAVSAALLYVGTYLVLVKRSEVILKAYSSQRIDTGDRYVLVRQTPKFKGNAELHLVYFSARYLPYFSNWFRGLFNLDSKRIRPGYWKSYLVLHEGGKAKTKFLSYVPPLNLTSNKNFMISFSESELED